MTFLRYSVLRLLLFFGCLLILWLVGLRDPAWLLVATALTSVTLSFFLLRAPREQLAQGLADRVAGRLPGAGGHGPPTDAVAEDAEADGSALGGSGEGGSAVGGSGVGGAAVGGSAVGGSAVDGPDGSADGKPDAQ